jgi:hypothetical protein
MSMFQSEYLYIAKIKFFTVCEYFLASAGRMINWGEIL